MPCFARIPESGPLNDSLDLHGSHFPRRTLLPLLDVEATHGCYRVASSIHVSSTASATTAANTATTIRLFVDITAALAYRKDSGRGGIFALRVVVTSCQGIREC